MNASLYTILRSGPSESRMGSGERMQRLTTALTLSDHRSGDPTGVADQSCARTAAPMMPPPGSHSIAPEWPSLIRSRSCPAHDARSAHGRNIVVQSDEGPAVIATGFDQLARCSRMTSTL